jgi:hypothetical protein
VSGVLVMLAVLIASVMLLMVAMLTVMVGFILRSGSPAVLVGWMLTLLVLHCLKLHK